MRSDRELFITHWKKKIKVLPRKKSHFVEPLSPTARGDSHPLIDYRATMFCLDAFLSRWWGSRQVRTSLFHCFGKKKGFQAEDLAPGHTGTLVRRQKNRPKEKCKPSTSRRHRNEDLRARGSGSNYRVISVPQPNACGHGETWQNMHIVLLLGGSVACGPSWPIVLSEFFYCSGRNFF